MNIHTYEHIYRQQAVVIKAASTCDMHRLGTMLVYRCIG